MKDKVKYKISERLFRDNLPRGLKIPKKEFELKILKEYGAMFAAKGGAVLPDKIVFKNEVEVSTFQTNVPQTKENIDGFEMELQAPAMQSLIAASREAAQNDLTITPRGADSAKRSYTETVELWASRVEPGLKHWIETGKLSTDEAEKIRDLPAYKQVPKIFELESKKMFFSKPSCCYRENGIIYVL